MTPPDLLQEPGIQGTFDETSVAPWRHMVRRVGKLRPLRAQTVYNPESLASLFLIDPPHNVFPDEDSSTFLLLVCLCFEIGSSYVALTDLELTL